MLLNRLKIPLFRLINIGYFHGYKGYASSPIMNILLTSAIPATVSTVETVKATQLLHNPSTLTTNLPYTRRELSCRISPSRPGIRSLFLCVFFQLQHVLVEVRHKQSVLNDAVFFKFCLRMELCNRRCHLACVL